MRVLFLGEGELNGPARYLAAVLTWSGLTFDHLPDEKRIPSAWQKRFYDLFILSDYRAGSFSNASAAWLTHDVKQKGSGFLMIGGWASFTGLVGGYAGHSLEALLPVRCVRGDDRVNRAALLCGITSPRPILVCGYHRAHAKPGTETRLHFKEVGFSNGKLSQKRPQPALVLGRAGAGRTAAFLTDCAPHWAGGLVDWGTTRIPVKVPGAGTVEVGNAYLNYFRQLILELASRSSRMR